MIKNMRKRTLKTVIAFYTTADAMETEDIFNKCNTKGRLIPVPREISAGCGIAWAMSTEAYKNIPDDIMRALPEPEEVKVLLL